MIIIYTFSLSWLCKTETSHPNANVEQTTNPSNNVIA